MIGKSFLGTCDKGTRTREQGNSHKGTQGNSHKGMQVNSRERKGETQGNPHKGTQGNRKGTQGNSRELRFPDARVIDDPLHGIINVANQKQKWTDMAKELSVEQLEIVACCLEAMNGPSGQTKFVSINAPAGYGKTYLARAIASCLRGHGHSICCTATAALASVLHEGGRTEQSANGIPVSESP